MSGVRVKICGLTRAADVRAAVDAGADAVGFVFAASKRRIGLETARALAQEVPDGVLRVGLFMDQDAKDIRDILCQVPLHLLQFHGRESNGFCRGFGLPYLKAVAVQAGNVAVEASQYPHAAGLLFDSHGAGGGGTGVAFDWELVPACRQPVWLAGGLHAGNVARAILLVRPWAVDVSSGVEDAPGIKSARKIREFIAAAKSACN